MKDEFQLTSIIHGKIAMQEKSPPTFNLKILQILIQTIFIVPGPSSANGLIRVMLRMGFGFSLGIGKWHWDPEQGKKDTPKTTVTLIPLFVGEGPGGYLQ